VTTIHPQPRITPLDRLGLTLFIAVVVHAVIILGISFTSLKGKLKNPPQRFEITLVQNKTDKAPENPDYLAQASQQGSGDPQQQKLKPQAPQARDIMRPDNLAGNAPETRVQPQQGGSPATTTKKALTTAQSKQQLAQQQHKTTPTPAPTANDLIAQSLQIASASAELQQRQQNYAKRKRHKYITASTQEYKYAAYQEAWRQKVERIGRLNYPEAARQRKLTGDLTMTVAIRADGSVASISLDRSSGYKLLDDAARRIVRLASPFAPLPDNIRAETDVLHITRTWIFHDGASFGSR
jgi:protein TonB